MKRQRQDSMGLMIDTMCNGVGGLVLVAIMIVLISMGESPSSSEGQMQRRQLENEVEALEIREELLHSENRRMAQNGSATEEMLLGIVSDGEMEEGLALIEAKKERIRELEARIEGVRQQHEQAKVADPGEYLAAELKVLNRSREEVEQLEEQLEQARANLADLQMRYSELLSEVSKVKELKSRTLKTPVERKYPRYDFIFVRYGKIYTLASEDAFTPGQQFKILRENEYSVQFEPKNNYGASLNSREVREFLNFVKRRGGTCSLGFYPDSFDLYLPIKEMINEYGLTLGIDFYTNTSHPGFTTRGGEDIMGQGQ